MKIKEKTETVGKDKTKLLRHWYIWVIVITGLSSFLFLVIFWCTNIFQNAILSNLVIQNGTKMFDTWIRPPVELVERLYIYNYTNVDDFESGKTNKLRVQQLGPYIYTVTLTRINIQIHENDTISYQEKKTFKWEGGNSENDMIVVPNILLITIIPFLSNLNYASRFIFIIIMNSLNIKPFVNITVNNYLWGYKDDFYNILKTFGFVDNSYENIGLLIQSNGVLKDRLMINTGSDNIDNLGIIESVNGKSILNIWGDKECDKIGGTDGTMFPHKWIKNQSTPLDIYVKEFCKSIFFNFHEYDQVQGIPSLKYKISLDSFQVSSKETCFCPKINNNSLERKCPPLGTLNVSTCYENLPLIISLPHFYGAEKSLIESIDGLKPEQNLHESTFDLHQFLPVPMNFTMRLQLNMEFRKITGIPFLSQMKNDLILPILWIENTLDLIPQDFINNFYDAHFTRNVVETVFRWGSIFVFLSSICALYVVQKNRFNI